MCTRRVNLFVYSLSLHRHSYIGFILAFASSIHNKQQLRWGAIAFTLENFSIVNLVFIFRCFSTTTNPVCVRRVILLVYSLSLHRHSYIGFILTFASSIHNKQQTKIASSSHTHPSYSQTSRLLTSSLSLGVPVPRPTQCIQVV